MPEVLAGYLYLKSKATADSDFGLFMATKKLGKDRKSFLRRHKSSAVP